MNLRKITETNATITLGWDPVQGVVEYRGTRKSWVKADGSQRWAQAGPETTQMKFSKDEWYLVEALKVLDSGRYPPSTPPSNVVYPSTSRYPSEASP